VVNEFSGTLSSPSTVFGAPEALECRSRGRPCLDPSRGETPSKEHRHARTIRSCGGYSVVGTNGLDAGVYPLRCGRWRCGNCGARLVRRARKRILAGLGLGVVRFMTLTSPGSESPEHSLAEFTERWKRLNLRIRRRFGPFEYAAVVELQDRGSPHLHVVFRGPFIPFAWLAKTAADVGFGQMVDIRRPRSTLAGYLTKSLGPGTSGDLLPPHFRRVRWSRGWSAPMATRIRRAWRAWFVAFAGPRRAAASAVVYGYRVVELINGPPDNRSSRFPVRWQPLAAFAARS
jgi:hypothetical protein